MSAEKTEIIKQLYNFFNARNIDGVLIALSDNVAWANGMEGGHVHGHKGLRDYWTRQWTMVNPHVEPVSFQHLKGDVVVVEVIQSVLDLNGQPLSGQTHGLKDKTVMHVFQFDADKIKRFDIQQDH